MSYDQREGDISIFKNNKREGKQPEYRGTAVLDGKKLNIALWVKEGAKEKFFAGRIEHDEDRAKKPAKKESELPTPDNVGSDDLPF